MEYITRLRGIYGELFSSPLLEYYFVANKLLSIKMKPWRPGLSICRKKHDELLTLFFFVNSQDINNKTCCLQGKVMNAFIIASHTNKAKSVISLVNVVLDT